MIAPNPHKDLAVKRKYFPRPRGYGVSLTPLLRGHSYGGEGHRSATRLGYPKQARPPAPGRGRAAPNTHADSGGPAPRGKAAVPGNQAPAGPDTHSCPMPWPVEKTAGSSPPRERPVRQGFTAGAGRRAIPPSFVGRGPEGVGRTLGWRQGAKPVLLETASRRSRLVPRPAPGPRPGRVAPRTERAGAAGVPSNRRAAGVAAKDIPERTRGPMTSVCHRCGWPQGRPFGVGSPAAPRPQCLTKRLTSKTSLVWSMW